VDRAVQDGSRDPLSGAGDDQQRYTDLHRLETYSAYHGETFDELGDWPAERFEAAWEAFIVRKALDELEQERRAMVSALHANGNLGGEELQKAVTAMQEQFADTRRQILSGKPYEDSDVEQFVDEKWWGS
jgi:hypothetical protein